MYEGNTYYGWRKALAVDAMLETRTCGEDGGEFIKERDLMRGIYKGGGGAHTSKATYITRTRTRSRRRREEGSRILFWPEVFGAVAHSPSFHRVQGGLKRPKILIFNSCKIYIDPSEIRANEKTICFLPYNKATKGLVASKPSIQGKQKPARAFSRCPPR